MTSYHDPSEAFELRAFRIRSTVPDSREPRRETHFAQVPVCPRCGSTRCGSRWPADVTMLCGASYDRYLVDEVLSSEDAGTPHVLCQARATQLHRRAADQDDPTLESTPGTIADSTIIASIALLSGSLTGLGAVPYLSTMYDRYPGR